MCTTEASSLAALRYIIVHLLFVTALLYCFRDYLQTLQCALLT